MPRQALSESVLTMAERLSPLMDHFNQQLTNSPLLYMDETPAPVLDDPSENSAKQLLHVGAARPRTRSGPL
jgi:hypothetical protein